jgi:hypothetical protein
VPKKPDSRKIGADKDLVEISPRPSELAVTFGTRRASYLAVRVWREQMLVAGTLAILVVLSLFLSMLSSSPSVKD